MNSSLTGEGALQRRKKLESCRQLDDILLHRNVGKYLTQFEAFVENPVPLREIQPQTIESLPLVAAAKADFEVVCEDGCEHLLGRRVALF
ncbi:hypothetical protein ACT17_33625 [Mycolicibacterium conceptionense]|uniref:Uncharacterized protein n=1 Tax=Mycolicibacterium conceptionense TaxID=451644 RepID=A0A0J8TZW3_9MYCO|nr:hypothetical protein ACT17_33625 [Mycolicibacterium conceptionense]